MKIALLAAALLLPIACGQEPLHLIRRPGVAVPDGDQRQLRAGLTRLNSRLEALKGNAYLADVLIFEKAVRYALDGNEFFASEDIFKAKELLRVGTERADQLARGDAPWTHGTGLVVRGYRSNIDGGVQPYGLVIPSTFAVDRPHRWRVDAWFHGRSETLSEVNFLWDRMHNPGQFTPRDTIMLHLYRRYCNASTFAGEVDFFEALRDVKKQYNVDGNRILVRGFSMGGASAWHIGAHYGTNFAAIGPGAGFAETSEFTNFTKRKYEPTWFEQKLLHLTNATDYAINFFNVPVVGYKWDKDGQRQAADVMAREMDREGLTLSRVWGLNIGHAYTPGAIVQIDKMMDAIASKGRVEWPREVRLTTWTLKCNRMRWVVLDGLEKHWERARLNASVEGWGDPGSNSVLARIADKLPIQWTKDSVSGITFREYAQSNNALHVAYLPDYAVVDFTTPPDARWPGKIVAAGLFGERWELLRNDGQ